MQNNIIKICMGSSCFSRGNKDNLIIIQKFIKDHNLEVNISLTGNLCEGLCKTGPNIFLNDTLYQNVTKKKINTILCDLEKELANVSF